MSPTDHEKVGAPVKGEVQGVPTPVTTGEAPLGLRSVAMFEFGKGILFIILGMGALSLEHRDLARAADTLIKSLHLDPTWQYSMYLVHQASLLTVVRLKWIGALGLAVGTIRIAEGYFLWHQKAWAEWFAVISSCIYLPIEIYHFYHSPDLLGATVFVVNLIIVVYLALLLHSNKKERATNPK